jgi:hypothetical protein
MEPGGASRVGCADLEFVGAASNEVTVNFSEFLALQCVIISAPLIGTITSQVLVGRLYYPCEMFLGGRDKGKSVRIRWLPSRHYATGTVTVDLPTGLLIRV